MTAFAVGQTVRVELPSDNRKSRLRRRCGLIATVTSSEACVLVTTAIQTQLAVVVENDDESEQEVTVPVHQLQDLLPFEKISHGGTTSVSGNVTQHWKSCGDTLMKLGDEPAAISFYERALMSQETPQAEPQIGSTAVFQEMRDSQWNVKVAEVDCVEAVDDDKEQLSVDVNTLIQVDPFLNQRQINADQEETLLVAANTSCSVKGARLLFVLPDEFREDDFLHERLLLNLTRCYLSLSETETLSRAQAFVKAALLAATAVEAVDVYRAQTSSRSEAVSNPRWRATALLLRGKAWLRLGQYAAAMRDARELQSHRDFQQEPALIKQARALSREIAEEQKASAKQTKKLVKEMCRWIDGATNENNEEEEANSKTSDKIIMGRQADW